MDIYSTISLFFSLVYLPTYKIYPHHSIFETISSETKMYDFIYELKTQVL